MLTIYVEIIHKVPIERENLKKWKCRENDQINESKRFLLSEI